MNRRSTSAAAAIAVTGALLLSACGSGDDSKPADPDKIAGADDPTEKPTSPSPTAPAAPGRPKIELPADITYTFDWKKTGDKDKDAVLSDGEQSIKAVDMAIAKQNSQDKAYQFYYEGEAAAGTDAFIKRYVDAKARTTGHYRFYNESLSLAEGDNATFSYCEDQGKAYVKHLADDKIDKTPVTEKSYVNYDTALHKNEQGVWVIQKILSQSGSARCQP
ncbi:hypothetical protein [Streptomyces sp. NPDC088725]|uniref:hypothetical protein n=1 Tax=Streptomyces sp. NPDC088725 TaxID=3365873 RepID=UPI00383054DA